jgi:hypothetical protein
MARPSRRRLAPFVAVALVVATATGMVAGAERVGAGTVVAAQIDEGRLGLPVPRSFVGLSIEYPSVPTYFGTAGQPNAAFVALLQTLGDAQRSAPALRIGGNSADEAWWNPKGLPRPATVRTDLGPAWVAGVAAVEARTHSPLTLSLNLALQRPDNALAFARGAERGLPAGTLQALEIGNEPDFYSRREPTANGTLGPPRFPTLRHYDQHQYLADVGRYAGALSTGLAHPPKLVVGAFAGTAWNKTVPVMLRRLHGRVQQVSVHAYPLHGCHRPPRPSTSVAGLLSDTAAVGMAGGVAHTVRMDHAPRGAVRVGEMNSVNCGGASHVSDTFASALWSTDGLFNLLHTGVSGVNLHTFNGARYAPFSFSQVGRSWQASVRPLYYGLLLFARAAPAGSRLVHVHASPSGSPLKLWATIDAAHTIRFVAINKSMTDAHTVTASVRGRRPARPASVSMLVGPSAGARGGVSLGGQMIGPDGRLHGRPRARRLVARSGVYRLTLPPAGAALITIPAGR